MSDVEINPPPPGGGVMRLYYCGAGSRGASVVSGPDGGAEDDVSGAGAEDVSGAGAELEDVSELVEDESELAAGVAGVPPSAFADLVFIAFILVYKSVPRQS